MIRHPAAPCDYRPGVCFDIGAAVGGAAQAAGTAAATAMQVNAEKQARQTAINTANSVAPTITNSATTANALLDPYASTGTNAINSLSNGLTENYLQSTPGYQFTLNQGEQAATNSAAARGLADSGAALKGASTYATGLADSTYQNQFNDTNALAQEGYNALGQQGNNTMTAANNAGQIKMEGANGAMATTVGAGNALASGLSSIGNTASQYSLYNALLGGGSSAQDGNWSEGKAATGESDWSSQYG
ncbi:hypothetical protein [Gluconobacter albidus]|uniref:Uncharacterized protein n=1 Tax=Gluconobacter albidus TaxID=318683 RepID=A0ABQ5X2S0_9PROT|nr:hypothetical protein [Gluconobacter albidus]GBQ90131.1 hypothetical protein AA3250_1980 [Gluconobacter albidus NBRC 3250]GLQ69151.1 hypothetical protein GCM10007866_16020 [Gluconobacter albidus]